ncbi:hypothetical protein HAX54_045659 [Datura stramonium]|uniref:Isopenicillin N synthase-like Fe(2+) 2OG dioxygenase domain-containing protein n=1 Tax=Datura stramonium TaxID=4076 RepID=A0ABS8RPH8_DATST|nr:hypothetical protein [Datura stramonium]
MARALRMQAEDMRIKLLLPSFCPQPELVMGLCPHTDAAALVILLEVNETEGLQIKFHIFPGAFVVSIGNILEPQNGCDLGPAPSLFTPQFPAKYRRIDVLVTLKDFSLESSLENHTWTLS